jgi:hypothetical protein
MRNIKLSRCTKWRLKREFKKTGRKLFRSAGAIAGAAAAKGLEKGVEKGVEAVGGLTVKALGSAAAKMLK